MVAHSSNTELPVGSSFGCPCLPACLRAITATQHNTKDNTTHYRTWSMKGCGSGEYVRLMENYPLVTVGWVRQFGWRGD